MFFASAPHSYNDVPDVRWKTADIANCFSDFLKYDIT